jgi:hypothetical protein
VFLHVISGIAFLTVDFVDAKAMLCRHSSLFIRFTRRNIIKLIKNEVCYCLQPSLNRIFNFT